MVLKVTAARIGDTKEETSVVDLGFVVHINRIEDTMAIGTVEGCHTCFTVVHIALDLMECSSMIGHIH